MNSNKSIGLRIKQLRTAKGLTMEEFGKLFNPPANKSLVSKWENGKSLPNNERLKKITEIGNISMEYLLEGTFKLEPISDMSPELKKQYLDKMINQTKYEALDKLKDSLGNGVDSYQEARFLNEVFTFTENTKNYSNEVNKEIFYNATQILSILNRLNKEFKNEKLKNDFKLQSVDIYEDKFNNSAEMLYTTYTKLLKEKYL